MKYKKSKNSIQNVAIKNTGDGLTLKQVDRSLRIEAWRQVFVTYQRFEKAAQCVSTCKCACRRCCVVYVGRMKMCMYMHIYYCHFIPPNGI